MRHLVEPDERRASDLFGDGGHNGGFEGRVAVVIPAVGVEIVGAGGAVIGGAGGVGRFGRHCEDED